MKMILPLVGLCLELVVAKNKYLSLVAFDGGGIKGIISATFIDNIEKFAYDYIVNVK